MQNIEMISHNALISHNNDAYTQYKNTSFMLHNVKAMSAWISCSCSSGNCLSGPRNRSALKRTRFVDPWMIRRQNSDLGVLAAGWLQFAV